MKEREALKLALESWEKGDGIKLGKILKEALAQPSVSVEHSAPHGEPDYAYPTIKDYEEIVGFEVGDAFKMGWTMARTTNAFIDQLVKGES